MAIKLTTNRGKTLLIEDKPFAKGGQGAVHYIMGQSTGMIAKIFHHNPLKTKKLEARIAFMLKNSPLKASQQSIKNTLIWPNEMLYFNGGFVGFTMPLAGDPKLNEAPAELVSLCKERLGSGTRNKAEWQKFERTQPNALKTRLKLCYNIARAIHVLHAAKNYVVVDLKPSNVLINSNGWMSIIDLDSIQISRAGQLLFHGEAVTEEYIPPEWQKNIPNLFKAPKNESWDRFTYAVIAYQLLLGIHPFTVSHNKFQSTPDFIREGLFPHGARRKELFAVAPPHDNFKRLPPEIQALFLQCFEDGYRNPNRRPSLQQWADTIVNILQRPPKIHSLTASTIVRRDATPVRISWQVENAGKIQLNKKLATGKSHIHVTPLMDTTYTLEVSNGPKSVSAQIHVKVDRTPPQIDSFITDKSLLTDHHPALLSWKVKRAGSISISGIGDVTGKNSCTVAPKKDTEYCLTATGYFGQVVTEKLRIQTSKKPPQIKFFKSSIDHREDGKPVYLSWQVEGANRLHIDLVGDVSAVKNIKVDPRRDTAYQLRAINYFGVESTAQLRVTVSKKPPVIRSFRATPDFLETPKTVQLQWKVSGAASLVLESHGDVTGKDVYTVNPNSDTRYVLRAKSYFQIESIAECTVRVSKEVPEIVLFYTPTPLLAEGISTCLVWQVHSSAKSVRIIPDVGEVSKKGRIKISPVKDCVYRLVAQSDFGFENSSQVFIKVLNKRLSSIKSIPYKPIPQFKEIDHEHN